MSAQHSFCSLAARPVNWHRPVVDLFIQYIYIYIHTYIIRKRLSSQHFSQIFCFFTTAQLDSSSNAHFIVCILLSLWITIYSLYLALSLFVISKNLWFCLRYSMNFQKDTVQSVSFAPSSLFLSLLSYHRRVVAHSY
jgi:hypothetical protein